MAKIAHSSPGSAQPSRAFIPPSALPWLGSLLPLALACIFAFIIHRRQGSAAAKWAFIGLGLFGSLLLVNENISTEFWYSSPARGYQAIFRRIQINVQSPLMTACSFTSLFGLVYVIGVIKRHQNPLAFSRKWSLTMYILVHFLSAWLAPRPTNFVPALWHMVVPTSESYTAFISVLMVPPLALMFTIYHQLIHRPRETGMPTTAAIISLDVILKCAIETCAPFFGAKVMSLMPKVVQPLNKVLKFLNRGRVSPFAAAAPAVDAPPVFDAWINAIEKVVFISIIAPNIVITSQGGIQIVLVALMLRLLKGYTSQSMFICDLVITLLLWNSIKYISGFVTIGVTLTLWLVYGARFFSIWTNNFGVTQQVIFYSLAFLGTFLVLHEPLSLQYF